MIWAWLGGLKLAHSTPPTGMISHAGPTGFATSCNDLGDLGDPDIDVVGVASVVEVWCLVDLFIGPCAGMTRPFMCVYSMPALQVRLRRFHPVS